MFLIAVVMWVVLVECGVRTETIQTQQKSGPVKIILSAMNEPAGLFSSERASRDNDPDRSTSLALRDNQHKTYRTDGVQKSSFITEEYTYVRYCKATVGFG